MESCGIPQVYDFWETGKTHPNAGQCRWTAESLAKVIDQAAGKKVARMIGGWFRTASEDYYYPQAGIQTPPPRNKRKPGEKWEEHWWVEVMGWYVDATANQFFPKDIQKQKEYELVITPASLEKYYPNRRRQLKSNKELPPGLEKLAKTITKLKKSRKWHMYPDEALNWLEKNAKKYGLSQLRTINLVASLNHEKFDTDFTNIDQVRDLLRDLT